LYSELDNPPIIPELCPTASHKQVSHSANCTNFRQEKAAKPVSLRKLCYYYLLVGVLLPPSKLTQ